MAIFSLAAWVLKLNTNPYSDVKAYRCARIDAPPIADPRDRTPSDTGPSPGPARISPRHPATVYTTEDGARYHGLHRPCCQGHPVAPTRHIARFPGLPSGHRDNPWIRADCKVFLQPEWSKSDKMLPSIISYVKSNPRWEISLQVHKFMDIP